MRSTRTGHLSTSYVLFFNGQCPARCPKTFNLLVPNQKVISHWRATWGRWAEVLIPVGISQLLRILPLLTAGRTPTSNNQSYHFPPYQSTLKAWKTVLKQPCIPAPDTSGRRRLKDKVLELKWGFDKVFVWMSWIWCDFYPVPLSPNFPGSPRLRKKVLSAISRPALKISKNLGDCSTPL